MGLFSFRDHETKVRAKNLHVAGKQYHVDAPLSRLLYTSFRDPEPVLLALYAHRLATKVTACTPLMVQNHRMSRLHLHKDYFDVILYMQ